VQSGWKCKVIFDRVSRSNDLGTLAADVSRHLINSPALAYGVVFVVQAGLFVVGGLLAFRLTAAPSSGRSTLPDAVFAATSRG